MVSISISELVVLLTSVDIRGPSVLTTFSLEVLWKSSDYRSPITLFPKIGVLSPKKHKHGHTADKLTCQHEIFKKV